MHKIILFAVFTFASVNCDLKDFADRDAFLMAQDQNRSLLEPPKELYDRIHKDLTLIRKAYPVVKDIHYKPMEEKGKVICNANTIELKKINDSRVGPIGVESIGVKQILITFSKPFNSRKLTELINDEWHTALCTTVAQIGISTNILNSVFDRIYTFIQGSGDCFAGCTHEKFYMYQVDGEKVTPVSPDILFGTTPAPKASTVHSTVPVHKLSTLPGHKVSTIRKLTSAHK